jgi:hypothetical protein
LGSRSVRRKVKGVFSGNGRDGASLLFSLEHDFDAGEIARGAKNAAFVAVVARQDPEAVAPGIVNDMVDVADRASWERVCNAPGCARVGRAVNVDFIARGIIEILPPVDGLTRGCGDVKRAGASGDRVGLMEFSFAWTQGDDRTRDGSDDPTRGKNGERVESITKYARRKAIRHGEAPAQRGPEVCDGLPWNFATLFNAGAEQLVSMGGVELVLDLGEGSQTGKTRDDSQGRWRTVHSRSEAYNCADRASAIR